MKINTMYLNELKSSAANNVTFQKLKSIKRNYEKYKNNTEFKK